MNMNRRVIESNMIYWEKENCKENKRGLLLYENFYDSPQLCYGISKVALCIAKSLDLRPAVLLPWKKSKMSESMCKLRFQMKSMLPLLLLTHFKTLVKCLLLLDRTRLLNLNDSGVIIGTYIYDAILRRYNKKTIDKLNIKARCYVILELTYYFYFKHIIRNNNVKAVVIGDNVYRYGLLFELCKVYGIVCYTPVNLNTLFLKCYRKKEDFNQNYLNLEVVEKLCAGADYEKESGEYYKKRYSGEIQQHDVLTAYANKHTSNRLEFCKKYNLDTNKKTVVIMSHVFADAPHVYLNTLYDDYWEWFVNTFKCLYNNLSINLLIKEHPSSHLFGQKGLVKDFLKKENCEERLISDDESTLSILQNADVIVTCGGTIGIEMSYVGKNVILASNPPYSKMGITKEFETKNEYENFLRNEIQNIQPLDEEKKDIAKKVSYVSFCCQDNWIDGIEVGPEKTYLGRTYNNERLYKKILEYNKVALEDQTIYKLLNDFVNSQDRAMFNVR